MRIFKSGKYRKVKGKNAAQIKILTLPTMLKLLFFCFLVSISLCHCSKNEASPPSYIKIKEIELKTNYNAQGSKSAKITDAWIYINEQFVGAFELPCDIPVSNEGEVKITIAGGIKNSGQANIREKYVFYSWYDTTFTLQQEQHVVFPSIKYLASSNFLYINDFENSSTNLVSANNSDTSIYISNNAFEGSKCAEITVNSTNKLGKVQSNLNFTAPSSGKRVFLEMNYTCNAPLIVGSIVGSNSTPIITLSSTQMKWNKIYIDLTKTLNQGKFEFYFEIQQISGEENTARFDNIKIIAQK